MSSFDLDTWLAASDPLAPIVQAGASVLRHRAAEVPDAMLGTAALLRLIEVMVEVMRAAPGVGLAAPQIAVPLRVFVAEDAEERLARAAPESLGERGRSPLPLLALVNPTVTPARARGGQGHAGHAGHGEEATFFEGCLSVRGYGALVPRALAVHVSAVDPYGRPVTLDLQGWPARIMQHEMDHLNGTLYVDRMLSRSFACDGELARLSGWPVGEVLSAIAER